VVVRSERARTGSWWWYAAGTVAVVGWLAALATTPPSALLASAVVLGACAFLFSTGLQANRESREHAAGPSDWRRVVDHTVIGALGAIAALGLLRVSVAATFLAALVLGATAPLAFRRRGTRAAVQAAPSVPVSGGEPAPAPEPVIAAPDLASMSTTDLVLAWRRSYAQLMRDRSAQQLAALAARRQQLLDELERRDSAGVERWLRSGARAASDPSRFLDRPTSA
jgi:hypothetical protein